MRGDIDFESLVEQHYASLYRFAFSLCGNESDAGDLVQETFEILMAKSSQIVNATKAKSWLFTTLYRLFLGQRKHLVRFPHHEVNDVLDELPAVPPEPPTRADWPLLIASLGAIDEVFRAPVALFYLEEYSYAEIATVLDVPLGTVKSRIARGIALLQRSMLEHSRGGKRA